jgi:23S rRNA pseudouridine1911/1915/1917 synthase
MKEPLSEQNEDDGCDAGDVFTLSVPLEHAGQRLDKALALLIPDLSRSRIQSLIEGGELLIGGKEITDCARKLKGGEPIVLSLPPLESAVPLPENIPLDIVFEDEDVIVLNKPAGMVVHPAAGHAGGTLVNALLYHCGDTLSGINGVRRPGIVHRLDKDTSGLMMVAKNDLAHHALVEQLQDRSLSRVYRALAFGEFMPIAGEVKTLIGRHPTNRLKMAVLGRGGREALTRYRVLENYRGAVTLVECRLATGRTHQIRVHMEHIGHPLIGDPLYGPQSNALRARLKKAGYEERAQEVLSNFPRQALHAAEISFIHPRTGENMNFTAPLPGDFRDLLKAVNG